MANFMRNWRRPSRVCLYVLSGVNFSVLFLCMSPSRTIICTPKFGKYFPTQNKHTSYISEARISDTINSEWHDSFFLLSCRPESPTCSAQGASCLSNLAARLLVSSTSSLSSLSHLTIPRSRLTQSVSHPATLFDACHTLQLVSKKLRTKYFAIFASNRPSAFLKHSKIWLKENDSPESQREEREIFIIYKLVNWPWLYSIFVV